MNNFIQVTTFIVDPGEPADPPFVEWNGIYLPCRSIELRSKPIPPEIKPWRHTTFEYVENTEWEFVMRVKRDQEGLVWHSQSQPNFCRVPQR